MEGKIVNWNESPIKSHEHLSQQNNEKEGKYLMNEIKDLLK